MTSFVRARRIAPFVVVSALLVAAGAAGCGGHTSSDTSSGDFVLGAYDNCYVSTVLDVPGGGGASNLGGGVTLAQSGSNLTVTYGGDAGVVQASSFTFTQTSGTSATLAPGQEVGGVSVPCAPLDFAPSVARLSSGSLTTNAGTLFLSVEGADEPVDAGGGCSNAGGKAAVIITCGEDAKAQAAPPSADPGKGSAAGNFVGVYSCGSEVLNHRDGGDAGGTYYASSGNPSTLLPGALTITETGGVLTATYAKDQFVEGAMQFVPTTTNAAVPATTDQTMQVQCYDPFGGTIDPPLSALPVTSSTLTIDGSSVVLSFFGNMTPSSTCPGAETFVTLLCTR